MTTTCPALAPASDDDPWTLAKNRFLVDVDAKEQELFRNATLENLYYSTSNIDRDDSGTSKARLVARKLGPLVAAIESYGKALDTFTNIAPLYLAPIWGCIRVVLVVAKMQGKFYDRILDTLGRIGDIMPRFRDYERIYNRSKHQRLTQALSNAYLDIIILCAQFRKMIREQKASSVRRILKPLSLDRQFEDAVERFRQHKQNVEDEARTCHLIEAAEERDAQLVLRAAEKRAKILSKLSKVDCRHRHRKLKESRHEGTGTWLSTTEEYQKWEKSPKSVVLCCHGIPGSGKSVLASSVIDSLGSPTTSIFYYCDYADKRTLEPANIFGTLARQALETLEIIPEPLAIDIENAEYDGDRLADQKVAMELFRRSVGCFLGPFNIVLDGLDETSETSQKIAYNCLREVLHEASCAMRLFLTGREDLGSMLRLHPNVAFFKVPVSASAIAQDIGSYVRSSTRRRIL